MQPFEGFPSWITSPGGPRGLSPDVPERALREAARPPKVTVLLPVRNGAAHLHQSLDSILSQTFSDLEMLVINDGSEDETPEILQTYAERDRRIRVVHQESAGLVKTLNRGLAEARTELVARQDADDLSEPTRIEKQVAYLQGHPEVEIGRAS